MRRAASLLPLALLLGWPATARPQSDAPRAAPPQDEGAEPPAFYETTTVTARPVSSATGSVTVVGPDEARSAEARTATELLQGVPGLQLLASGGRAGQTNAYLRGGDPNYTLVLLDGIPLNDSTDLQGGAVNLEELPAGLVERAEIVRGPFTSFYGTSSLSGVIQLFTPRGGPGPLKASLGAEAGNANLFRGLAGASGPAGERGGVALGLSWDQERHRVAEDRFRQLDAWASASLGLGATTDLRLVGRFADGEAEDYPDASGGPVYGSGELRSTTRRDLALGAQLATGGPAGRRHQLSVGLSRRERDRTSPAVPPVVPASSEQATFTRLRLAWQVPLRRTARTEVDAGASGEGEWGENASVLSLPPFLGGDVPGDYRETRWSGGAFAGVRHETGLGSGPGSVLLEAVLRADVATTDSLQLNPHAGIVVRPGEGTTRLRASAGRASKLPSFFALASPRALGGNPDLRAESAWGGEAGVEHDFRGARLSVGAAYFLQRYEDLVDFDFEQFLHVNRSRVRTQGVELVRPLAAPPLPRRRRAGHVPRREGPRRRRPPPRAALDRRGPSDLAARREAELAPAGAGRLGLLRRADPRARPRLGGRLLPPGLRGLLARRPRPHAPGPPGQPDRPVLRDAHRLPGPRALVLGGRRLGPVVGVSGTARGSWG